MHLGLAAYTRRIDQDEFRNTRVDRVVMVLTMARPGPTNAFNKEDLP